MSTPLCPVAALSSCQRCPIYKLCPAKTILGDVPIKRPDGSIVGEKKAPESDQTTP